jgi:hypothetical protein
MNRIILMWGTVRPDMMYETYKHWMDTRILGTEIIVKVAVYTEEQKQQIDNFNIPYCEVFVINEKPGYTYAVYKLSELLEADDDDILIYISDDFYSPEGWDAYLFGKFLNWDGALFLNDGYQSLVKQGQLCLTISCLTFKCLKEINRLVLHPDYRHFFSDNEAFINLNELGLLKDDRDIDDEIFQHRHYVRGFRKQDEHDKSNLNLWGIDNATFEIRMKLPISERLKYNG